MMMKKLVTLGLGVMLSASLLAPVNASQVTETTEDTTTQVEYFRKGKSVDFGQLREKIGDFKAVKIGDREPLSQEEYLAKLQERLDTLEEKFAAGDIDQDRYDSMKERLTKVMEAIENGELPDMGMKRDKQQREPLSLEEMLEKLNERLEKLEEAYSEGKVDQDRYEKAKERLTSNIEKVENGEMPTKPEPPTQEEMLEKLNEKLAGLETKLNDGDITDEQYNTIKEKLETMIEKVENGEQVSFRHKGNRGNKGRGFGDFANLTKEEQIEKLQEKLTYLETALNEGRIDQEKYDAAKTATETLIEKIQNDEELTDMKTIFKTREAKSL